MKENGYVMDMWLIDLQIVFINSQMRSNSDT